MNPSANLDTFFLDKFCESSKEINSQKDSIRWKESLNLFDLFANEAICHGIEKDIGDFIEESYCWRLLQSVSNLQLIFKNEQKTWIEAKKNVLSNNLIDASLLPISQLDLIEDLISVDRDLISLLKFTEWLNGTSLNKDMIHVNPINFKNTLASQREKIKDECLEADFLFNDNKNVDLLKESHPNLQPSTFHMELRSSSENVKLLKNCFELIRSGQLREACEILKKNNQGWRAISLSGGLPFHDFRLGDDKNDVNNKESAQFERKRYLLDFMDTPEWQEILEEREHFYQTKDPNVENYFSETVGNLNWLLWLNNSYNMSLDKNAHDYERGIYALLSGNVDFLKKIFDEGRPNWWYDQFWAYLRSLTYNEIIRRYLRAFSKLKNEIPMLDPVEDISNDFLKDFSKSDLGRIINHESRNFTREINEYLDNLELHSDNFYKRIQIKTIKAILNSNRYPEEDNWSELINYLYELSKSSFKNVAQEKRLEKLRFFAYFSCSLHIYDTKSNDVQFIDNIMGNYLEALSSIGFRGEKLINLYSIIKLEDKRIKTLAKYLTSIKDNEEKKKSKTEINDLFGKCNEFSRKMVEEILISNNNLVQKNLNTPQLDKSQEDKFKSERENARLNSLTWLNHWSEEAIDNLNRALMILRETIKNENYNMNAAKKLCTSEIDKIFMKAEPLNDGKNSRIKRYFEEKRAHNYVIDAFLAMRTHQDKRLGLSSERMDEEKNKESLKLTAKKINNCVFGLDFTQKNAIYDVGRFESLHHDELSTNDLNEIRKKLLSDFIECLIEIYDTNNMFQEGYELLKNVSNPRNDCAKILGESNVDGLVRKMTELIIKNPRIIHSLLQNKGSA